MRPSPDDIFWAIWGDVRSLRSVADEFGTTPSTVRKWCREDGIPYPSGAEAIRLRKLRRRASLRTVRTAFKELAERELRRELDRLWADHGCEEWLERYREGKEKAEV
jgi:hypothetical protein